MIKVCCATGAEAKLFADWYSELTILGHESKVTPDIDLLILTGGGDIDPSLYGAPNDGSYGIDKDRDAREIAILSHALRNSNTKVLGVCRGMQLLSAYYGYKLIQNMPTYGLGHSAVHNLVHYEKNAFDWLTVVNSLHHQAVSYINKANGHKLLAAEPKTSLPEIVEYGPRAIGVQFHPEMFSIELGNRFFSVITDWVMNQTEITKTVPKVKEPLKVGHLTWDTVYEPMIFTATTITTNAVNTPVNGTFIEDMPQEEDTDE